MEDQEKDSMDLSLLQSELNILFGKIPDKSGIKVKEITSIIIPYIREARQNKYISYGKTLDEMKNLKVPISRKIWGMVIDKSSIDEIDQQDEINKIKSMGENIKYESSITFKLNKK